MMNATRRHPMWVRHLIFLSTLGLLLGFFLVGPAGAQTGSVTGSILDASTGGPLDAVQVTLERVGEVETGLGGLTRATGRYLLLNIPAGQYLLRAQLVGFGMVTEVAEVTAGETAVVDLRMSPEAIPLSEIVVTGVIGATQRTKLPFDVAKVQMADLPVASVSAGTSLQGKLAGVQVVQPSGLPGSAASILLRGVTSLDASGRSQDPLYIVDEVILGSGMVDLDALDIQSIEVVKGAAAASLYGSRAANGVIHVRTKRGAQLPDHQVRYTIRTELGRSDLVRIADRMKNQTHPYALTDPDSLFLDNDGTACAWLDCRDPSYAGQLAGDSTVTEWNSFDRNAWPSPTYDQVDRIFTNGPFLQSHITAEGRTGRTNFHLAGSYLSQDGILVFLPGYERATFRANLDQSVRPDLTVQASTFFSRSSEQLWENRGSLSSISSVAPVVDLLAPDPDHPDELVLLVGPNNAENPLYSMKYASAQGKRSRFLGAATVRYSPSQWLSVDGNVSFDRASEEEEYFYPKGYRTLMPNIAINDGYLYKGRDVAEALNGSLTASARWNPAERIRNTTQLRYLIEIQDQDDFWTDGYDFAVKEVPTLSALNQETAWAGSGAESIRSDGVFIITNFDLDDRLVVDALVRNDGSSLFGEDERRQWYYRLGGAWRISQEDFFNIPGIDELKARYSVGTAGGRPRFNAQYETFSLTMGRVSPKRLGNRDLKPEFSTEHEAGIDVSLFDYRAMLTLTYARTTTENQILEVPLPQLSGYLSQWQNAGTIASRTWEATLDLNLLQSPALTWSAKLLFDATRSEITELTPPDFKFGYNNAFLARDGERIGTFYGVDPARGCGDLPEETLAGVGCGEFAVNDDGFLVWVGPGGSLHDSRWGDLGPVVGGTQTMWGTPFVGYCIDRVTGEQTAYCPLGNSIPDYNLGLSTHLSWKGFTAYGLLSRSVGFDIWNQQAWVMESDQGDTPLEEQKPIGYYQSWYGMSTTGTSLVNGIYVEDGTFTKVRELSLAYRLSSSLFQRIPGFRGVTALGLSVTGRNLYTWTDYSGFDPDTGRAGGNTGSAVIARIDNYNYPPFRTWTFGVELVF